MDKGFKIFVFISGKIGLVCGAFIARFCFDNGMAIDNITEAIAVLALMLSFGIWGFSYGVLLGGDITEREISNKVEKKCNEYHNNHIYGKHPNRHKRGVAYGLDIASQITNNEYDGGKIHGD